MPEDIYSAEFLKRLFDEMQGSYERVSDISSFGFNRRWRKQCAELLSLKPGDTICDLMTGTGEVWMYILPRIGVTGRLYSVDFSPVMAKNARERKNALNYAVDVLEEDALASSLPDNRFDGVISTYGLKTFNAESLDRLIAEIKRILKPGGQFALIEISIPDNPLLRFGYFSYLKYVIPLVGKVLLGNHENYRYLSEFLIRFKNCRTLYEKFRSHGFDVRYVSFFFGCATAITGSKTPAPSIPAPSQ